MTVKLCKKCGIELPLECFYKGNCRNGTSYWCKTCQGAHVAAHRHKKNIQNPGGKHGLDADEYWGMIFIQDNRCANVECGAENPTHIDHDHDHCPGKLGCRKCVRGVLCMRCNTMLGFYEKNKKKFVGALRYAEGSDFMQGVY